jgi:L-rhamnose isomerase
MDEELMTAMAELVRLKALDRAHLALDYFDASINRVGAWVLGMRSTQKALLKALLEPARKLLKYEEEGNGFARLALLEETKTLPLGAVLDYFCLKANVPGGDGYIGEVMAYEKRVLAKR